MAGVVGLELCFSLYDTHSASKVIYKRGDPTSGVCPCMGDEQSGCELYCMVEFPLDPGMSFEDETVNNT